MELLGIEMMNKIQVIVQKKEVVRRVHGGWGKHVKKGDREDVELQRKDLGKEDLKENLGEDQFEGLGEDL